MPRISLQVKQNCLIYFMLQCCNILQKNWKLLLNLWIKGRVAEEEWVRLFLQKLNPLQMKHSYHTDLAIQHQLGLLRETERKNIPKSTLHSWKCRDFSKMIGSEIAFSDEKIALIKAFLSNQTLIKAAKGLFFV